MAGSCNGRRLAAGRGAKPGGTWAKEGGGDGKRGDDGSVALLTTEDSIGSSFLVKNWGFLADERGIEETTVADGMIK